MDILKLDVKRIFKSNKELVEDAASMGLAYGHITWMIQNGGISRFDMMAIIKMCPKVTSATAIEPNATQRPFLNSYLDGTLASLMSQIVDKTTSINPINCVNMITMLNQVSHVDVHYMGSTDGKQAPFYVLVEEGQPKAKVDVLAGLGLIGEKTEKFLRQIGAKKISRCTPQIARFGVNAALIGKFSKDRSYYPVQLMRANDSFKEGFKDGKVDTQFPKLVNAIIKTNSSGVEDIIANVVLNAKPLADQLSKVQQSLNRGLPMSEMGGQVTKIHGIPFVNMDLNRLAAYYESYWMNLGTKREYLKRCDLGDRSLNAAYKWSLPLSLITGSPFKMSEGGFPIKDEKFQSHLNATYFGCAGGRAIMALENRFADVFSYDVRPGPKPTKRLSEEQMDQYNVPRWETADITQFENFKGDVLISDVYMDRNWSKEGWDHDGHSFVSCLLKGKMAIKDGSRELKGCPSIVAVKGFIPTPSHMSKYDLAYPFILCDVGRPCTTEVIYMTPFDNWDKSLALLKTSYNHTLKGVFKLIKSSAEFEDACRKIFIRKLKEILFQIKHLSLDYQINLQSPFCRVWWMHSDDFPCYYLPRKFGLIKGGSISVNANAFAMVMGLQEDYAMDVTDAQYAGEEELEEEEDIRDIVTEAQVELDKDLEKIRPLDMLNDEYADDDQPAVKGDEELETSANLASLMASERSVPTFVPVLGRRDKKKQGRKKDT